MYIDAEVGFQPPFLKKIATCHASIGIAIRGIKQWHRQQGTNSKMVGTSKLYIPSHFRYSSSRREIIQKTATTNVFYIFV